MAFQPKLVNKQFNSPIGLYSQQNIQEVLDRESQILANGAVGINFNNPDVGKPANLKNSAVLRMLEEEENRQRNGIGPGNDYIARPLRENITWPPPEYDHKNTARSTFKDVVVPGTKRVTWPPPGESGSESPYVEQNAVSTQGGPQFTSQSPGLQQNNYQAPAQQRSVSSNLPTNRPLKPLDVSTGSSSSLSSPLLNQSPAAFRSSTPSKGWAPVQSPVASPSPPSWQQHSPAQNQQLSSAQNQQLSTQNQLSSSQNQLSSSQSQKSSTTTTRFQTAHHSVSQQTYLGQQYSPSAQVQYEQQYQYQQQYQPTQQQYQPTQQQYQPPQQQYQPPQQQYQSPQPQYQPPQQQQYQPPQQQYQPQQQYNAPQQQYQPPQQQYQAPQQQYQAPQQQYQAPQQQYQPPQQQYQAPQQQYQAPQQQYQTPQQQQQPPQQYQASTQQNQAFQPAQSAPKPAAAPSQIAPRAAPASKPAQPPPPSTITLRPKAPVSQAPPPLVTSQPATATFKGGKHLRGDLKWPPEVVRQQVAEENRLLLELANGPACKPRRPNKDYTEFFSQHALNSTYPGYKIPPGTQFFRPV